MTEDIHLLLGAYILGGLDAHERRLFEAHLDQCTRCRDDVASAAPLPALLSKVDADDLLTPDTERDSDITGLLLAAAAARRAARRRTVRRATAAGAITMVAAAAVVAVVVTISQPPPPSGDTLAMRPVRGEATGTVTLTEKPWGTAITLELKDMPRTGVFTLRTTDDGGATQSAANWAATANGVSVLQGATSIPMSSLRTLSVIDAHDRVMATASAPDSQ